MSSLIRNEQLDCTTDMLGERMSPQHTAILWAGDDRASAWRLDIVESAGSRRKRRVAVPVAIDCLREFITDLEVPDGMRAEASSGWLRDPARPEFVSCYGSEATFVRADPHRAAGHRDGDAVGIDGPVYGTAWRRDGDDDDPVLPTPSVSGPWRVGYIPATGEVYASRRCRHRPPAVWLLARGVPDTDQTHELLTALRRRHMLAPNSLLLVAAVVHHAAQLVDRPSRQARK